MTGSKGTVWMVSGWLGSPRDLRNLGRLLAAEGWRPRTPPGLILPPGIFPRPRGKRVVLGYSAGATPALELTRRTVPDALILVSPLWRFPVPVHRGFAAARLPGRWNEGEAVPRWAPRIYERHEARDPCRPACPCS